MCGCHGHRGMHSALPHRHPLSVWPAPLAACKCSMLAHQCDRCAGAMATEVCFQHCLRHRLSVWPAPLAACSVACLHINASDVRVPWAPRYAFSITSQTPVECLASSAGSMQCSMLAHQCVRCSGAMGTEHNALVGGWPSKRSLCALRVSLMWHNACAMGVHCTKSASHVQVGDGFACTCAADAGTAL